MSYDYFTEKPKLFLEENQKLFLAIRDQVEYGLSISGAITMERAARLPDGIGSAGNWEMMACIDRLVELGELQELPTAGRTQNRVFVRGK